MLSKAASSTIFFSFWYDLTQDWTPVSRTIKRSLTSHTYIYTHTYTHTHTHTRANIYTPTILKYIYLWGQMRSHTYQTQRERKGKSYNPENICVYRCVYTWMYVNVCEYTYTLYFCIYIHKKNICRSQRFSRTIKSNRTFTNTDLGIKKGHASVKTNFTIKAWNRDQQSHYQPPEEDLKCKTRVEHKYMK